MNSEAVNVICMKWGDLYTAEDVNNLFCGVARHLDRPFRFVCLTDDSNGFMPEIEALPLPTIDLPVGSSDTRWNKLLLFQKEIGDLAGQTLFLDLDLVVVGDLDVFFDLPGEFLVIRDDDLFRKKWFRKLNPERDRFMHMVGNTSVFRFVIGAHTEILQRYLTDMDTMLTLYEHEQQCVSDLLDRQGKLQYWPKHLCVSFKNDCVGRGLTTYFQEPVLPPDARIVIFAGSPKMSDVLAGRGGTWYRRIGKIDWLEKAWRGT